MQDHRLLFVGSLMLLASSERGLQHAFDRFAAAWDQYSMKLNTEKTKDLCLLKNPSQCVVQVNCSTLQHVEKFKKSGGIHG